MLWIYECQTFVLWTFISFLAPLSLLLVSWCFFEKHVTAFITVLLVFSTRVTATEWEATKTSRKQKTATNELQTRGLTLIPRRIGFFAFETENSHCLSLFQKLEISFLILVSVNVLLFTHVAIIHLWFLNSNISLSGDWNRRLRRQVS